MNPSAPDSGGQEGGLPFVTAIMPVRNEADWLERSLGAVLGQDYPMDRFELLVADGDSDDGSRKMLDEYARKDPRVKIIANPERIVATGLNRAIRAARGSVIARVDAHTVLANDYIRCGVDALERTGADNVGGPMVTSGGGPIGEAVSRAMGSRLGIGASFHFADNEHESDTTYMGMWPRAVFERVGLFDEELVRNQDDELNYRIRAAGGRVIVSPLLRSRYQNRQSWSALLRQFFDYGVWKVRVLQKHPRQMSLRHFIPPGFDLFLVAAIAASPFCPGLGRLAVAALLGYFLVMGAVSIAGAGGVAGRLRLFAAFTAIHHAWAMGFVFGFLRFAPRWLRAEPGPPVLGGGGS